MGNILITILWRFTQWSVPPSKIGVMLLRVPFTDFVADEDINPIKSTILYPGKRIYDGDVTSTLEFNDIEKGTYSLEAGGLPVAFKSTPRHQEVIVVDGVTTEVSITLE